MPLSGGDPRPFASMWMHAISPFCLSTNFFSRVLHAQNCMQIQPSRQRSRILRAGARHGPALRAETSGQGNLADGSTARTVGSYDDIKMDQRINGLTENLGKAIVASAGEAKLSYLLLWPA